MACFELEVIVVVVGLRSETDLLHHHLHGFGFLLLLVLFSADTGISDSPESCTPAARRWARSPPGPAQLVGYAQGILNGIDALFHIFADKADFTGADAVVDSVELLEAGPCWRRC